MPCPAIERDRFDAAMGGVEATARGWVLFGPDGRLPIDGRTPAIYRHVQDGRSVQLDEVPQ
jgi:hypothetical protein